ncbi:DUF317 domain-containing protein [Streptomyces sp. NPDC085927]|uniref:DUF317 domain-containing protein n=1 Tax=Streptomyces sp. NPDC085927 TaxID=3365738 RepID=UPI0037D7AB73
MPVNERQLAEYERKHAGQIPFDTSPRHLAGPGDARHVTHGLAAAGWSRISDPLSPQMVLTSPDHRRRLQFTPESGHLFAWWQLASEPTGTEPYWWAGFGELVPAEVLAGVTDAVIAPPPARQPDPWQAVSSAGWVRTDEHTAHSADGMCSIELHPLAFRDAPSWHIETHETGFDGHPGRPIWHARFHEHTPVHLVNAFVTALADSSPLQRGMYDRAAHYSAVQEPSPLTPKQVVAAHITRLDALRAQARTARRKQQPATSKASTPPRATASVRR